MKLVDEFRDRDRVRRLSDAVARELHDPVVLMEVCGGQTHSIVKYGIDELLPAAVELVHGPGCPVCVTALETIDRAHAIASDPRVIFCSFGDMLRVPGTHGDFFTLRANGADVRLVYSPLDALAIAERTPERPVVFFAIGFETTAPANAMAIRLARLRGVRNFHALVSHVLVPPAIATIFEAPDNRIDGMLAPGHVCAVMGTRQYEPIAREYEKPIVVTGFEPVDLMEGILRAVRMCATRSHSVDISYARAVTPDGNQAARRAIEEVFEPCDRAWRGIGVIPASGLRLRDSYRDHDAEVQFGVAHVTAVEPPECIAGAILRGLKKPADCSQFGGRCTPDHPLGATMVSSEGACAAYYAYRPAPPDGRRALDVLP